MSGHSKWSQIKHQKASTDAKKSKEFSRLVRLITVESRLAGGNVSSPSLKTLIEKAKAINMPKDTIERAVAKGKGGDGAELESITYELYGPGGVALLVDTLTDNKNRTVQELKHLVSKQGYALAEPGSASWAFRKEGTAWIATTLAPLSDGDTEALSVLVDALEAHDDVAEVYTNAE
jgi:YebC/PmpR family DNA-binding regulatory protein